MAQNDSQMPGFSQLLARGKVPKLFGSQLLIGNPRRLGEVEVGSMRWDDGTSVFNAPVDISLKNNYDYL